MKLRILFVTLMVTFMANAVFGVGQIYWDPGVTANWIDPVGDDPINWYISDAVEDYCAYEIPTGTREITIYGPGSDITVNTDVAFTSWFSNRGRIFGGATVRIQPGANVEGFGWLRAGEGSKAGSGVVIQTGGALRLENGPQLKDGSQGDYKDPAGLTIGDGNTSVGMGTGYYEISGGTIEFLHHSASSGRQAGNIRIGDRRGEGTLHVKGSDVTIQMRALDIGGRNDKPAEEATRRSTGHLQYTLDADGASAIEVNFVDVHSYATSTTTLVVKIAEGVTLADEGLDILLVNNVGTTAVHGLFDTFNGGSAAEGTWAQIQSGAGSCWKKLTYVGGDGNDIVLIPEPATLALLSLGMFIIRRKK